MLMGVHLEACPKWIESLATQSLRPNPDEDPMQPIEASHLVRAEGACGRCRCRRWKAVVSDSRAEEPALRDCFRIDSQQNCRRFYV